MTIDDPTPSGGSADPSPAGRPGSGDAVTDSTAGSHWLERLGLHRPELRAWALYDWANSAFVLVVVTAVFPIYYQRIATDGGGLDPATATKYFSYATAVTLGLVALLSPALGAIADFRAARKRFLAAFIALGSLASAGLATVHPGEWQLALVFFAIGNLALFLSFVFYDSLLPHLARDDAELDRVSTAGYAIGYLGSGLLLLAQVALIQNPHWLGLPDAGAATRFCFLLVAVWWALFSIPILRRVPEPARVLEGDESSAMGAVDAAFSRLRETLGELRGRYRPAFWMLVAFMIYNEGIGTIIRMGAIYAETKAFPESSIMIAILLIQFVGIPFAFAFGALATRFGAKQMILVGLAVYCVVAVVGYTMETVAQFYLMAALIAAVQGGTQGLSRSLFGAMIPKHKASELFGFFSVFSKVAGIIGPLVFGLVIELTGSIQHAVLSVVVFFIVGALLLTRVDVAEGKRKAGAELDPATL
ncbi:MAG: MFS transporter [Acidobacteriota bacterium]